METIQTSDFNFLRPEGSMTALRQAGIVAANFVLALASHGGLRDGRNDGFPNYGFQVPAAQGLNPINPVDELDTHDGTYVYQFDILPSFYAASKGWKPIPVTLSLIDEGHGTYQVAANDAGPIEVALQIDAIGNFDIIKLQAHLYRLADALVRSIWSTLKTVREVADADEMVRLWPGQFNQAQKDAVIQKANLLRSTVEVI